MTQIRITSGMCEPVRSMKFPGFRNTFIVVKMKMQDLYYNRFAVIDRDSMMIILVSASLSALIYRIADFLSDMTQDQFDVFIGLMREFNE